MFKNMMGVRQALLTLGLVAVVVLFIVGTLSQSARGAEKTARVMVRGGGTTMIEGGTGSAGGFVPVLTTVAFHAASVNDGVAGSFECLARAPQAAAGAGSADFTTNAMYVTGEVTSVKVSGDVVTLAGSATITGLGAGSAVPFTFVAQKGGPGATAVLTTDGNTHLEFHEVLVEGSFEVD
jgi:hypothetical protein